MYLLRNESVEAWPQEMIGSNKHTWQWDDVFRECKIFVERDCHRTSLGRSLQDMSIGRRMSLRLRILNTGQIINHSDQKLNMVARAPLSRIKQGNTKKENISCIIDAAVHVAVNAVATAMCDFRCGIQRFALPSELPYNHTKTFIGSLLSSKGMKVSQFP